MMTPPSTRPQRRSPPDRDDEFARILAFCVKLKEELDKAKARTRIALYKAMEGAYGMLVFCEENAGEDRLFDACNNFGVDAGGKNMFLAVAKLGVASATKVASKYACSLELAYMHHVHPNDFLTFLRIEGGVEECSQAMAAIRKGESPQSSAEGDQDGDIHLEPAIPEPEVPMPGPPSPPTPSGRKGYAEEKAAATQAVQEATADALPEHAAEVIIDEAKPPPAFIVRRLDGSKVQLNAADCLSLKQLACKYAQCSNDIL